MKFEWKKFDEFLIKFGFVPSQADSSVYFLRQSAEATILNIWVALWFGSKQQQENRLINHQVSTAPVQNCSKTGWPVDQQKSWKAVSTSLHKLYQQIFPNLACRVVTLKIHQPINLKDWLKFFNCRFKQVVPFPKSDQYLILQADITIRPEISFAEDQVAQFTTIPGKSHYKVGKRILNDLKFTISENSMKWNSVTI